MFKRRGWELAAIAVLLGMCAQAKAGDDRLMYASLGEATRAPIGWVEYCAENPADCRGGATQPRDIVMSQAAWRDLNKVNHWVNETVKPMTDMDHWGVIEKWSLPTDGYGDCEDYVLEKRRRLSRMGISLSDLLITVVRKPDGEGHSVLTVRTDKGDYVLDNLNDKVKAWDQTGYRFLKRQAIDNTGRWVSIRGGQQVLVGSVE